MADRVIKLVLPRSKVAALPKEIREKRVAAYARVFTDSNEQMGIAHKLGIPPWTVRAIIYRAGLNNTPAKKAVCLNCGNEFECLENSRKYCCRECYMEHRYGKRQDRTEG